MGSIRDAFWRWQNVPWPETGALYDTQWMDASVYVYPGAGVELWLSVGSWGGYPAWVEIADLAALCTASPTTTRNITATAAMSTCRGCCVSALTPLDPNDTDSATMEAGYSAWNWLSRCTADIQEATPCFRDKVLEAGGSFPLTNTLRTEWYQRHFRQIWDNVQALNKDTSPECATVKQEATREKAKHGLRFQPAGLNPRHVYGEAIDIGRNYGLTEERLLELAGECNLYRRVPADRVHFEIQQP